MPTLDMLDTPVLDMLDLDMLDMDMLDLDMLDSRVLPVLMLPISPSLAMERGKPRLSLNILDMLDMLDTLLLMVFTPVILESAPTLSVNRSLANMHSPGVIWKP